MRRLPLLILALLLAVGCGKSSPGPAPVSTPNGPKLKAMTGTNVMPLSVNGSLCSADSYPNKPCVTVKVCAPGTSNCQTIDDVLLDTGSSGLRVFKSVLTVPLTPITGSGGGSLTECTQFADGSSEWGPVEKADVVLAGEPAVTVPIQVVDSTFTGEATNCGGSDSSPDEAGFNGILGVGLFAQDCGVGCESRRHNHSYFECSGGSCAVASVSLADQVQNPVSLLPKDNNGVIVMLPSVPAGGAASADGYVVLGIGTQANNKPSGVTAYPADPGAGVFRTAFAGNSYPAFLDTGSNSLAFPSGDGVPDCGSGGVASGFFCASPTATLTATAIGAAGSPSGLITFQVGDFASLIAGPNRVFFEIAASADSFFDWGLPFHFGRNVYVGLENTTSPLGQGPLWAF